ncbi:MAG TPA: hypothetical protein VFQ44_00935 [Streptosporangiaceae bacterium]|nr:hypothetical protein [Streptosporangiaceae bacterium]
MHPTAEHVAAVLREHGVPGHVTEPPGPVPTAAKAAAQLRCEAERAVRALYLSGQLAKAAELVDQLGPYGVAEGPDGTLSLGAAVLDAYADQLTRADRRAADAAYLRAAELQRSFAAAATSGGEGIARMMEAGRIEAKCASRQSSG